MELHSNSAAVSPQTNRSFRPVHETLEVTTGIADNFEFGFYVFTRMHKGRVQYIGNNIRPRELNWTPGLNNPFIIARTHDPFDKQVQYNANGKVRQTSDNPYALTFDPTYVYAPNQGMGSFAGMRFTLNP